MAWRNLWRNRRRTLLTLVAITFGLLLAILFTALQDRSFADMIDLAARMGAGHVTVEDAGWIDAPSLTRTVKDTPALVKLAESRPHVLRAVPRISGPVMLATAGHSYGAGFMAIDPAQEDAQTMALLDAIHDGTMLDSSDGKGVLLGARLAHNLEVGLGDKVVYTLMDKQGEIQSGLARVQGLLVTGSDSADGGLAVLPLQTMRSLLGYAPGEASQVAVFSDDARKSEQIRADLQAALAPTGQAGAQVVTWNELQPELKGFIAMKVGGARFMEGVILLLVAASIFNTLFVSVLERSREFGILMALGWTRGQVFGLVMWESLWLALVGVSTGGLVTWVPYHYLATHPIDISAMAGGQSMDIAGVGMSPYLHVGIFPESLAVIVTAVILSTLLSGLYPAWRAGRTVPVDAIKLV